MSFVLSFPSSKKAKHVINSLVTQYKRILVVDKGYDENLILSLRNFPNIKLLEYSLLNPKDIMNHETVLWLD